MYCEFQDNFLDDFCGNLSDEYSALHPYEFSPLTDFASETDNRNDHTLYDCSNIGDVMFSMSHVSSNYDGESGSTLMDLVCPNEIQPYEAPKYLYSPTHNPFLHFPSPPPKTPPEAKTSGCNISEEDMPDILSYIFDEDYYSNENEMKLLPTVSDKFIGDIIGDSIDNIDEALPTIKKEEIDVYIKKEPEELIVNIKKEPEEEEEVILTINRRSYHPDYDHCYSKSKDDSDTSGSAREWPSMYSPDSSGSSSEVEVDVVTVTETHPPVVPKAEAFYQISKSRRKVCNNSNNNNNKPDRRRLPPMLKGLDEAMIRNIKRVTTVRRAYNRRKVNNSVETTPSNSAPSSRCSSDVEDAGKRRHHNTSERNRRQNLKICLNKLKSLVPSVMNNPKSPKVQVLQEATAYIKSLKNKNSSNMMTMEKESRKGRVLMAKLKKLRRELRK